MKYIYTSPDCSKCDNLKKRYNEFGIPFVERPAERIKSPEDDIDREALIQASMQNMELPVEVEAKIDVEYECPQCGSECLQSDDKRTLFCSECDFAIMKG